MTRPDRGGPEAVDSFDIVRHFGFGSLEKLKIITKVLSDWDELKLWYLP